MDAAPWVDRKSPVRRVVEYMAGPTSRLFVLGSWTFTSIVAFIAWGLSDDAKMTYIVNSTLQRSVCT